MVHDKEKLYELGGVMTASSTSGTRNEARAASRNPHSAFRYR